MRPHTSITLVSVFSIVLYITSGVAAQPLTPDIQVSPSKLTIKLSKSLWGTPFSLVPSVTLNVHSLERNVSVVDIFADTFFEEQARWPPISSKILDFTVSNIQLSDFQRTEILVSFNIPSNIHPGTYTSKIYITSSRGSTVEVPISLKISESEVVSGFFISMGVMLNLVLFMIKDIVDERNRLREIVDATEEHITRAYQSICKAIREQRFEDLGPASNYILGQLEFNNLINDWNKAIESNSLAKTFIFIGKKADRIENLVNDAKPLDPNVAVDTVPLDFLEPPSAYQTKKDPEDRFKYNPIKDVLWRSENLQYVALILTFAIIVVNSWQTYLGEAIAFGASGLADYLAALLFGFGSQTVLTQGVGMAKSWAESRAPRT